MKKFIHINKLSFLLALILLVNLHISAQLSSENGSQVKIGLLVNKQHKEISQYGAQKAIDEINRRGGVQGKPIKLIVKSVEGEWGAGSAEIVDLVFNEKVRAIIGTIDGQNSHLAEQVIAKTQLLYVSAWATDPTLSKAYVPWYFSIVPTDHQQAVAIIEDIELKKGLEKVLVIHDQSYDTEHALKSIYAVTKNNIKLRLSSVLYDEMDTDAILSEVENNEWEALIFLGRNLPVSEFLQTLASSDESIPVYSNLSVLAARKSEENHMKFYEHFYVINSGFPLDSVKDRNKIDIHFQPHLLSDAIAAYTYDGIMLIAEALRISVKDGNSLVESISKIHYQGITGDIEFDELGRLKKRVELQFFSLK